MSDQKTAGISGIHHVAIRVRDFDKSVKFYTEGLGFSKGMAWGEGDKRAVMLDMGGGNYLEVFAGGCTEEKPEGAYLHLALHSENCDKSLAQAVAAGACTTMEPTDIDIQSNPPTPVRIAFCKGFDGEIIEFFQNR